MSLSEIMTILIAFHQSHYRNFKRYYLDHVCIYWSSEFPKLPSYQRFVEWMPSTLLPLCVYLKRCFGECTGISFIDATSIKVCQHGGCISWGNPSIPHRHNRRIPRHRVFLDLAERGKTSVDWFFGFKLHLVVNDRGELLNVQITAGNTDDRKPVPDLVQFLFGKIFAERRYVSQPLATKLFQDFGIQFFAKPKRNMRSRHGRVSRPCLDLLKNRLILLSDKLLARKRSIIETVIDRLKNISQIEHSRHRSPVNFGVNILCGLIAYCYQPKKPSLNLEQDLAKYS